MNILNLHGRVMVPPFFLADKQKRTGMNINFTRLAEAVIISLFTALVISMAGLFLAVPLLKQEMQAMQDNVLQKISVVNDRVERQDKKITKIYDDMYMPAYRQRVK